MVRKLLYLIVIIGLIFLAAALLAGRKTVNQGAFVSPTPQDTVLDSLSPTINSTPMTEITVSPTVSSDITPTSTSNQQAI